MKKLKSFLKLRTKQLSLKQNVESTKNKLKMFFY